jgi:hypothetical protein
MNPTAPLANSRILSKYLPFPSVCRRWKPPAITILRIPNNFLFAYLQS